MKYNVIEMLTEENDPEKLDQWTNDLQLNFEPFNKIITTSIQEVLKEITKPDVVIAKESTTISSREEYKREVKSHAKLPK